MLRVTLKDKNGTSLSQSCFIFIQLTRLVRKRSPSILTFASREREREREQALFDFQTMLRDHVTVTFPGALYKAAAAFFHRSFERTLENIFCLEKRKTRVFDFATHSPPSPPSRRCCSLRAFYTRTHCSLDSRIIFPRSRLT